MAGKRNRSRSSSPNKTETAAAPSTGSTTKDDNAKGASTFSVAVVGGGLVGSLAAIYFAQRGWAVTLYELRKDIRAVKQSSGRSINLALSVRGISALEGAGAGSGILETLIPMKGRMIHIGDGKLQSQAYGVFGECINSVDRKLINEKLLDAVEKYPNVKVVFECNLSSMDVPNKTMMFKRPNGQTLEAKADFIVGADGAFSHVRRELMRVTRISFQQDFIEHAYVELNMPPDTNGNYKMDPNHLHIWPRETFMMIALPNVDRSFTVTLFMPWEKFDSITNEKELLEFFEKTFPDSVPLIGKELLVEDYFKNPKGALVSVKCKPYHYKSSAVIIGDAAHAMVPFYGQGMNCGFEDCLVLNQILDKHLGPKESVTSKHPKPAALEAALEEYTRTRNPDAEAICDLAMYNYVEMRSSVTKWSYLLRKKIESFLYKLIPKTVIPLYTMVSFTRIPYSQALERNKRQGAWFGFAGRVLGWGTLGVLGLGAVVGGLRASGVKYITYAVQSGRPTWHHTHNKTSFFEKHIFPISDILEEHNEALKVAQSRPKSKSSDLWHHSPSCVKRDMSVDMSRSTVLDAAARQHPVNLEDLRRLEGLEETIRQEEMTDEDIEEETNDLEDSVEEDYQSLLRNEEFLQESQGHAEGVAKGALGKKTIASYEYNINLIFNFLHEFTGQKFSRESIPPTEVLKHMPSFMGNYLDWFCGKDDYDGAKPIVGVNGPLTRKGNQASSLGLARAAIRYLFLYYWRTGDGQWLLEGSTYRGNPCDYRVVKDIIRSLLKQKEALKITLDNITVDWATKTLEIVLPWRKTAQTGGTIPFRIKVTEGDLPMDAFAMVLLYLTEVQRVAGDLKNMDASKVYLFSKPCSCRGGDCGFTLDTPLSYNSVLKSFRDDLMEAKVVPDLPSARLYKTHSFRRGGVQYFHYELGWTLEQICDWGGWSHDFNINKRPDLDVIIVKAEEFRSVAPGSQPEPNLPRGSEAISKNYYHNRDVRRAYPQTVTYTPEDISKFLPAGAQARTSAVNGRSKAKASADAEADEEVQALINSLELAYAQRAAKLIKDVESKIDDRYKNIQGSFMQSLDVTDSEIWPLIKEADGRKEAVMKKREVMLKKVKGQMEKTNKTIVALQHQLEENALAFQVAVKNLEKSVHDYVSNSKSAGAELFDNMNQEIQAFQKKTMKLTRDVSDMNHIKKTMMALLDF
ncbi:hypothetical protein HDV05_001183 [Chytridiales sp. JEL 0842]|nr:hypothetical protein HDV05_001183 [Chytridiales sp. JEL 0842]